MTKREFIIQEALKTIEEMGVINLIQGSGIFINKNLGLLEDSRVFTISEITALDYSVSYIRPYYAEVHRYKSN